MKNSQEKLNNINYTLPSLSLLSYQKETIAEEILQNDKKSLEKVFDDFNVNASITDICVGPKFTVYETLLSPGTKLNKLTSLKNEIALRMAAYKVDFEISTKSQNMVSVIIHNKRVTKVYLREVISELKKHLRLSKNSDRSVYVALGKGIRGDNVLIDLCQFPNLLISGSTGTGISMLLNSIILSILLLYTPEEVKLILFDSKKVEFFAYQTIPQLLYPVITSPIKMISALKKIALEIEERYKIFHKAGVQNISEYKEFLKKSKNEANRFPRIVIIIDDIDEVIAHIDGSDTISYIMKHARATGIYMIIAAQRSEVSIITREIKERINARIAFSVPSASSSRVILDEEGAEKLDGLGDMLLKLGNEKALIRIQGCYIDDNDIKKVADHCKSQNIINSQSDIQMEEITDNPLIGKEMITEEYDDPLYDQIVDFALQTGKISASILQRRFKLGYNRCVRIVDLLEKRGIVGPQNGSEPREVLVKTESTQNISNSVSNEEDGNSYKNLSRIEKTIKKTFFRI